MPQLRETTAESFRTFRAMMTTIMGSRQAHRGFSFSTVGSMSFSLLISAPVGMKPSPLLWVRLTW